MLKINIVFIKVSDIFEKKHNEQIESFNIQNKN